jgi:hypothetical protein
MGALVLAVFFKFNLAAFHFGIVHWQHSLWQAKRVYIFMWSPGRWRLLRLRNGVEKDSARRHGGIAMAYIAKALMDITEM